MLRGLRCALEWPADGWRAGSEGTALTRIYWHREIQRNIGYPLNALTLSPTPHAHTVSCAQTSTKNEQNPGSQFLLWHIRLRIQHVSEAVWVTAVVWVPSLAQKLPHVVGGAKILKQP